MNINFLNLLSEKLNVGSMRSIYLNALPGRYKARMDITDLNKISEGFSERFFENLLSQKSFSIRIKLTNEEKNQPYERKIQYLFHENMNTFREEGISSFALGYPLIIKQNNKTKSVMKSPLFVWKLNIERSKTDINEFIISRDEDSPIEINKVLLMQILSDDKVNLSNIYEEITDEEEGILTYEEISNTIKKMNEKIKLDFSEEFKLEPFPETVEGLDSAGKEKTFIFYGGVLGLFKRQKEGIIKDFVNLTENYSQYKFNVSERDNFQLSKNTSIATDPSQQNVIETLTDSQYKIIQGPPGTGKSQTLTAIITNSLENGANILIVCEKKTALDVIYEKLSELGIEDLIVMLNDPAKDRRNIVKRVRDLADKKPVLEEYDEVKYNYVVKEYKELKERYNNHQAILSRNIKGNKENSQNMTNGKVLLGYLEGKNREKYYHVDTSRNNMEDIYRILDLTDRLLNKIGDIGRIERFEKIYNEEMKKNIQSYEIFFNETSKILEAVKKQADFIRKRTEEYGEKFTEAFGVNKLKVSLFSIFNSKLRDIKNSWEDIYKGSNEINNYGSKYFNRRFTEGNYRKLEKELEEFSSILNEITKYRNEFISFLDEKKNGEMTKEEEAFINNFIKYINENVIGDWSEFLKTSYFYSLLQNSGIKTEGYRDYTANNPKLLEFDKYIVENQKYRIKKYWGEIRKRALSVIGKTENIKMLYNLRKNSKYGKINTLREIIETDVDFFKDMFPIIMTDPNTCSSVFPLREGIFDLVLFDEASQLKLEEVLPSLMRGKYKIVSGDMHQMPPSNYFGSEMDYEGTSDNEEMDEEALFLADSESLLDFVNNLNEDVIMSYLDFHYRSKHPKLINFSNAAFYESRLVPMPSKTEYTPIEYYRVDGVYKGRKNDDEADKIIEYIFSDNVLIEGKLSSVGIVTLNLEQKTNIVNRINSYLRENDSESVKERYNSLMEKGMFVKNLENVQGDERDIMILSTTFGSTPEGKFIQNFGPLNNQQRGYKLLNVLITRAKYKFIVFTSIPEENINIWENEVMKSGNNGKGIFYAYLAYAKAVSESSEDTEKRILNTLSGNKGEYISVPFEDINNDEGKIVDIIKKEVSFGENDEIVKNYKIGGFTLSYAVKDKNEKKAKIVIDVNTSETFNGNTAYRGIIYRKGMFEGMGYKYRLLNMTDYI